MQYECTETLVDVYMMSGMHWQKMGGMLWHNENKANNWHCISMKKHTNWHHPFQYSILLPTQSHVSFIVCTSSAGYAFQAHTYQVCALIKDSMYYVCVFWSKIPNVLCIHILRSMKADTTSVWLVMDDLYSQRGVRETWCISQWDDLLITSSFWLQ